MEISGKRCPFEIKCQPSFGLKTVNTGHSILSSLTEGQLFQWLSGSKLQSRQTWIQAQKKQMQAARLGILKNQENKALTPSSEQSLFFLLYFSPHILLCFGTKLEDILDYDFVMEEAWYKRPTENISMPKLVRKSMSITSTIFCGGGGQNLWL